MDVISAYGVKDVEEKMWFSVNSEILFLFMRVRFKEK